jgi:hypothetical protein
MAGLGAADCFACPKNAGQAALLPGGPCPDPVPPYRITAPRASR